MLQKYCFLILKPFSKLMMFMINNNMGFSEPVNTYGKLKILKYVRLLFIELKNICNFEVMSEIKSISTKHCKYLSMKYFYIIPKLIFIAWKASKYISLEASIIFEACAEWLAIELEFLNTISTSGKRRSLRYTFCFYSTQDYAQFTYKQLLTNLPFISIQKIFVYDIVS